MAASQKKKTTAKRSAGSSRKKTSQKQTGRKASGKASSAKRVSSGKRTVSEKQAVSARGKSKNVPRQPRDYSVLKDILVILTAAAALVMFISCFVSADSSLAWLHNFLFRVFGLMSYAVPVLLFLLCCFVISNWRNKGLWMKVAAVVTCFLAVSAVFSIMHQSGIFESYGGGIIGNAITGITCRTLGMIGSYILMAAIIMISVILFFGHSIIESLYSSSQKAYKAVSSQHQLYKGQREIHTQERRLVREQKRNQALEQQRLRLEQLQAQRLQEQHRGEAIRDFADVKLEEAAQSGASAAPEASGPLREKKSAVPTVTIEGTDMTDDFSRYFEESYPSHKEPTAENEDREQEGAASSLDHPVHMDSESSSLIWEEEEQETFAVPEEKADKHETGESAEAEADAEAYGPEEQDSGEQKQDTQESDKPTTKTVVTATGKVITVELDGLPGENKRPREPVHVKTRPDQYEEKVVPIAYEEPKEYVFPSVTLLKEAAGGTKGREEIALSLKDTAAKLQQTLQDFGVGVTITNISRGPSVTRYELQPEQGVKVSRIVNLADDIKLNLAAEDIRIEAPIPGKAAIGIEVPNKEKVSVAFRELVESDEFRRSKSKTIFAAGKDIAGKTVIADIEKMPHLLIAGATGSGKSVCINTIIMSILYKAKPSEVKLIMIDPKVVELSVYNGIPHLLIPVVTDPKKAAAALNWAVNEMEDRYRRFSELKARNISGYNAAVDRAADVPGKDRPQKLPQIIVIVDELADLIMTAANEVEDAIQRLAQKARAAGIHLIIATQRPSVNVITGVIKANIPSRIAFSVSSGTDSRTIIDMNGAEKLLGKGDMLFAPYYVSKPLRVQGAFVSDEEVSDVVSFLLEQKNVIGGEIDSSINLQASMPGSKPVGDDRDELFETAGYFIIEQDKASIGNLQRHLRIGFNRAARIMDQLYAAGVVSKDEGTKPRKVLMTQAQFEEYISER